MNLLINFQKGGAGLHRISVFIGGLLFNDKKKFINKNV